MAPILDTHIWVWWMLGDPRLGAVAQRALDDFPLGERPLLSDISLWEVAMLVAGGRLVLEEPLERWLLVAASPLTVQLTRLSSEIVVAMNGLPSRFQRDPADRIIISTAMVLGRPLFTLDQKIIDSGIVPIWTPK
jgi:PIN domain nuclease of toxin-antitoxin system